MAQIVKISVLCLFLVCGICESFNKISSRDFLGGKPVSWDNYPYFVSIMKGDENYYGGAIIDEQHVLTDMGTQEDPANLTVKANGNVVKKVTDIFTGDITERGFLAVVKVDSPFDLSGTTIAKINLPDTDSSIGTNCTYVGIGNETNSAEMLRYEDVPIVEEAVCNDFWGKYHNVSEGQFCTGGMGDFTCYPDMGDPVICDGTLFGIAYLPLCNEQNAGVNWNVNYQKSWIEQQLSA